MSSSKAPMGYQPLDVPGANPSGQQPTAGYQPLNVPSPANPTDVPGTVNGIPAHQAMSTHYPPPSRNPQGLKTVKLVNFRLAGRHCCRQRTLPCSIPWIDIVLPSECLGCIFIFTVACIQRTSCPHCGPQWAPAGSLSSVHMPSARALVIMQLQLTPIGSLRCAPMRGIDSVLLITHHVADGRQDRDLDPGEAAAIGCCAAVCACGDLASVICCCVSIFMS